MNIRDKNWKKYILVYGIVLFGVLPAVLVADMIWMSHRMHRMAAQLTYLQDTASVIQMDVGTLQDDIDRTLGKGNSILESCSIDVVSTDYRKGTYRLEIAAIPREYTDKTKMSIFFGTTEYSLVRDGFTFTGNVELKMTESYAGNVTVLITNGSRRSTQVLVDYEGFRSESDEALEEESQITDIGDGAALK